MFSFEGETPSTPIAPLVAFGHLYTQLGFCYKGHKKSRLVIVTGFKSVDKRKDQDADFTPLPSCYSLNAKRMGGEAVLFSGPF
jgi:hypothetical protein